MCSCKFTELKILRPPIYFAGMTLYLKTNNLIFCRLSTELRTGFVHGLPYNSLLPKRRLLWPLGGWSGWQRIFLPRHMGGVLVSRSKVNNVSVKSKFSRLCAQWTEAGNGFKSLYPLDVTS